MKEAISTIINIQGGDIKNIDPIKNSDRTNKLIRNKKRN